MGRSRRGAESESPERVFHARVELTLPPGLWPVIPHETVLGGLSAGQAGVISLLFFPRGKSIRVSFSTV